MLDDLGLSTYSFDVEAIRCDFPILREQVNGHPLIWLDNGATTQKPQPVIDRLTYFYEHENSNVHRAAHELAARSTDAYESAREKTRRFLNAGAAREIVFVRGATEGINLVAQSWGRRNIQKDDEIVITWLEHHANIVPWHMLAAERGLHLRWVPIDDDGALILDDLEQLLDGAKLLALTCMSNVLGTLNPVRRIADLAHAAGAVVVADGAQSVPHLPTDVASLGVDFLAFSAHKMLGPTGIGVLWGREELLSELPPFLGGGEMILDVRKDGFTPNDIPWRFEAGTPPITEAVGLGAAVDYLDDIGMESIRAHEITLTTYAMAALTERFGSDIHIFGPKDAAERGGVLSFTFRDVHPHDISQILDQYGVCVRAGHHCAKPLMRRLGVNSTARASFALYNDETDVDTLVQALDAAGAFFR